jgi:hypothetical protein
MIAIAAAQERTAQIAERGIGTHRWLKGDVGELVCGEAKR